MTDIDFIPPHYHAKLHTRRRLRSQLGWGIALAAVMAAWTWVHQTSTAEANEQLDQARSQWGQLVESFRCLEGMLGERDQLERRGIVLGGLDDPASLVVVLAELSALLPEGAVITQLVIDAKEGRPVQSAAAPIVYNMPGQAQSKELAKPDPSKREWRQSRPRLHIIGAAPTNVHISAFTAKLSGSPYFSEVNTQFVKDAAFANRQVRQFGVDCVILPQRGGAK